MNEQQIRRTFDLLQSENKLIEVRIIAKNKKTYSGYFKDVDKLISVIGRYNEENIYFILNEISEACYSRDQKDIIIENPKITTSDNDIIKRNWFLIDVDPKRPAGVCAIDNEKQKAKETGYKISTFLKDFGFSSPIGCDSGNGFHLLYKIDLQNNEENKKILQNCLQVLDLYFSNEFCEVDKSVFNAARITKLYGTFARKGKSTEERPHRESVIRTAPDNIKITPIELLKRLSDLIPVLEKPNYNNNYGKEQFDLDDFLFKNGIKIKNKTSNSQGNKYILESCVFNDQHKGKDSAIFQLNNGALAYKCFHDSCYHKTWTDVRLMFDPMAYKQNEYKQVRDTKPFLKLPQENIEEKGNKFVQVHEIKNVDRSKIISIPSKFNELDKKIIGFNKGEMSLWSGKNGSGKSTILNQIVLNSCEAGFIPLIFSGELTLQRVKNWLLLQAAGRQNTRSTEYENLFFVPNSIISKIETWLQDKLFIYNNKYGNEYNQLLTDIKQKLKEGKIDILVLDNIMSIDFEEMSTDKYNAQKKAFLELKKITEENNIHTHIVAHPRKSVSFLRKDDISGTSDMANIVENILICHRNNNDFKKAVIEFFPPEITCGFENYSNFIEVCKNRDLGVEDYIVGLHYEKESKRYLNYQYENLNYGWQEIQTPKQVVFDNLFANAEPEIILTDEIAPF